MLLTLNLPLPSHNFCLFSFASSRFVSITALKTNELVMYEIIGDTYKKWKRGSLLHESTRLFKALTVYTKYLTIKTNV